MSLRTGLALGLVFLMTVKPGLLLGLVGVVALAALSVGLSAREKTGQPQPQTAAS